MPDLTVLDTSVAVGWFFTDEPQRRDAVAVRDDLRIHARSYVVPPLFHAELVHVLSRKSDRDARFVADALALILRTGIRTLALSEDALRRTVHWACKGLGGYDATFIALAEDLGGRWLTADERAVKLVGRRVGEPLRGWSRRQSSRSR